MGKTDILKNYKFARDLVGDQLCQTEKALI